MKRIFLGGTCNGSKWRNQLIPLLNIDYFNPVVDNWTDECQKRELLEREICDYVLYVITNKMTGIYSIAEAVDDSNKRPHKTIFTIIEEFDTQVMFTPHQIKSLQATGKLIENNGGKFFKSLEEIANFVNVDKSNSRDAI